MSRPSSTGGVRSASASGGDGAGLLFPWSQLQYPPSDVSLPVLSVPFDAEKKNKGDLEKNSKTETFNVVKKVTPRIWESANLESVLHEQGFGSLGCRTDWSAP